MNARLRSLLRGLAAFARAQGGNITIMSAVFLPVTLVLAAFAVDHGSLYLERRTNQGLTDLAAIAAANNMDDATNAALRTFHDNDVPAVASAGDPQTDTAGTYTATVEVTRGQYTPDRSVDAGQRFVADRAPYNAVRVTMRRPGMVHLATFLLSPDDVIVRTTGTAHVQPLASFSIGSRLLRIEDGILNALLNELLGTEIALTAMDYEALLDAEVDVLEMLDALATELDMTAVTYDRLLAGSATLAQVATAAAGVLGTGSGAGRAMLRIAGAYGSDEVSVPLNRLAEVASLGRMPVGEGAAVFAASVVAFDLVRAATVFGDGEHQVSLDLDAGLPGISDISVRLAIGEPAQHAPSYRTGSGGEVVRTAQTRLALEATVGGLGALAGKAIRLPLYVEVASAEAWLMDIACRGAARNGHVNVSARPGIVDAWIGEVDPAAFGRFDERPDVGFARLVNLPLVRVEGRAYAEIANPHSTGLAFTPADIRSGTVKRVSTRNFSQSLLASLLQDPELRVSLLGLGILQLNGDAVADAVADTLAAVAAPLDTVLYNLLTVLGVSLGEADIRVDSTRCDRAVLVQ